MNIYDQIKEERKRQDEKRGEQNHSDLRWLGILAEAFGEVAKEVTEISAAIEEREKLRDDCDEYVKAYYDTGAIEDKIKTELTQTIAVAVQWLEAIERRES